MAVFRRAFSLARWLVVLEIGIWRSLFLWATRRVPGQRPGVESFSYASQVTPLLAAFILVSALEVSVVHLLLPWDTVRLAALGIGIWGLLWMVGFLASVRVFRHLVDDTGLCIRHGTRADIRIPWDAVESIISRRGSVPANKAVQVDHGDEGTVAHVAVLKQTNVAAVLRRPISVEAADGTHDVAAVRFYVDHPRAFIATAHEHLPDRRSLERLTKRS